MRETREALDILVTQSQFYIIFSFFIIFSYYYLCVNCFISLIILISFIYHTFCYIPSHSRLEQIRMLKSPWCSMENEWKRRRPQSRNVLSTPTIMNHLHLKFHLNKSRYCPNSVALSTVHVTGCCWGSWTIDLHMYI